MNVIKDVLTNQNLIFLKIEDDEGVFKVTVAKEFAPPFSLDKGRQIEEEELFELTEASKKTFAVLKALDALSYSNHSRQSLVSKLTAKYKIEKEYAVAAADYAVSKGYIDEVSQAKREAALAIKTKGRGKKRIALDLMAKGYSKDAVCEALDSFGKDEYYDALCTALKKKAKCPPRDKAEEMKIISAMERLGHGYCDVQRAIRELFADVEDESVE